MFSKGNYLSLLQPDNCISNGNTAVICALENEGLDLGDR
jgi:hypothetical protein